mmetsp:Transcript_103668/g.293010  ORF Transcript_103668/g.293010 Transcript_103668/m.293010 type:complete len:202 (-) Transcript_103668:148-753(-)
MSPVASSGARCRGASLHVLAVCCCSLCCLSRSRRLLRCAASWCSHSKWLPESSPFRSGPIRGVRCSAAASASGRPAESVELLLPRLRPCCRGTGVATLTPFEAGPSAVTEAGELRSSRPAPRGEAAGGDPARRRLPGVPLQRGWPRPLAGDKGVATLPSFSVSKALRKLSSICAVRGATRASCSACRRQNCSASSAEVSPS